MTLSRPAGAVLLLIVACSSTKDAPPVFGGQGAELDTSREVPLQEGEGVLATGPCAQAAPAGVEAMLEDFEDGDHHLFKVFERDGWWFTATDETAGVVLPPRDGFKPTLVPEAESTPDNRYAAHLAASGFTDWGAVWGVSLEWRREGIKCPYNGSKFQGLRLRAKGTGRVRVNFGNPATVPPENGGQCKQGCYDTHGKMLDLTPEWTEYTIPFDKLQQGGWGTQARFDAERLLTLNFSANPEWQPVDFWIDDLAWIVAESAPASSAAPSGVPPASSASAVPASSSLAPAASVPTSPAPVKPAGPAK